MTSPIKYAVALAGALMIGAAGTASAAPVATSTAAVKAAVPGNVTDVRWGGWHGGWHGGWRGGWGGPGLFFGGLAAGLATTAFWGGPYWGGYYPYGYYPYPSGYYGYAGYPYPYWRGGWGWRHRHWYRRHW